MSNGKLTFSHFELMLRAWYPFCFSPGYSSPSPWPSGWGGRCGGAPGIWVTGEIMTKTKTRTPKRGAKKPERDWRLVFLDELSCTGNVSAAAKKAKVARNTAYLERAADKSFADAWDAALEVAKAPTAKELLGKEFIA